MCTILFIPLFKLVSVQSLLLPLQALRKKKISEKGRGWKLDHSLHRNRKRTRLHFTGVLLDFIQVLTPYLSPHEHTHYQISVLSHDAKTPFYYPRLSPPILSLSSDWQRSFTLPHIPGFSYEPTGQSWQLIRFQILVCHPAGCIFVR